MYACVFNYTHTLLLTYMYISFTVTSHLHRPLSRNHMISRLEKHLGDLYLLMGQLQQASAHYRTALPSLLKNFKDWLWAGSVYEGLCVTAIITKECEEVLGQKAQGTAISGTGSIFFKKVHVCT